MKITSTIRPVMLLMILSGLFLPRILMAQDDSQARILADSKKAKASFLRADPSMENLFRHAAGYAIFPNIGKGGVGVGGAAGKGAVYVKGTPVCRAQMVEGTGGEQAGGGAC